MNRIRGLITFVIMCFVGGVGLCESVNAAYYGTGSGSGGIPTCSSGALSTCYGATWKKYKVGENYTGMTYSGTSYYIQGRGNGASYAYAASATIDVGSCRTPENGGQGTGYFWRYAMVASKDFTYGNGVSVVSGQQVGIVGLTNNSNPIYNSEFLGGSMNYFQTDASWDDVKSSFEKAKQEYPQYFNIDWESNLAWFCEPVGNAAYLSVSNASNSKVDGYATTGINGGSLKTAYTAASSVNVGETVRITFSHNIYSNIASRDVRWNITQTGFSGLGVSTVYSQYASSPSNLEEWEGQYYTANYRPGSDGSGKFLSRRQYDVTFPRSGTYTLCEMITVDGASHSKACTKVTVGTGSSGICGSGAFGSYNASSGQTSVVSKVNNSRLGGTYSGWRHTTYAMPGDVVTWTNCYYPGSQTYANTGLVYINGSAGNRHNSHSGCSSPNTFVEFQKLTTWTNVVSLTTTSPSGFNDLNLSKVGPFTLNPRYTNGDNAAKTFSNNKLINATSDVKQTFEDTIYTATTPMYASYTTGSHSWTACCDSCGGCCGCYRRPGCCGHCCCNKRVSHSYTSGTWNNNGTRNDDSNVTIPYNFVNTTEFSLNRGLVYAAETITVNSDARVHVGTRYNRVTEADYATIVRQASAKLVAYVSPTSGGSSQITDGDVCNHVYRLSRDYCVQVNEKNMSEMNSRGDLNGSDEYMFGGTYNVFDAPAGNYMCFVMAVYPATSGVDTNTNDSGDGSWYLSAPRCSIIAKKPSVQILGGDLFANGSISTNVSTKQQIYGTGYSYEAGVGRRSNEFMYGSWVEEGIVANGNVIGLSSGASLGLSDGSSVYNGVISGGLNYQDFCLDRTSLSFANYTNSSNSFEYGICSSSGSVQSVGRLGVTSSTVNRKALADYWGNGSIMSSFTGEIGGPVGTSVNSATGKDIRIIESSGDVYLYSSVVGKNTTRIIKSNSNSGKVTIAGDITYDGGWITTSGELPKVIIYGQNIDILCGVKTIDAILIAENEINTCSDADMNDVNQAKRSSKLVLNGAVIANKIILPRTYGNGIGNESGKAAETFNYDTTTTTWGRYMSGSDESDTMNVTYIRELAPRY